MKLLNLYLPVFKLVINFAQGIYPLTNYEDFRQQCILKLEQAISAAEHIECTGRERDEAFFAVVFWMDEFIMRSSLPYISQWRTELLQVKYFQTTIGGKEFFQHLNQLEDEHSLAKCVYLFCLQQGFQGQYAGQNSGQLQQIIQQLRWSCLPEAWVGWPNDAELISIIKNKNQKQLLIKYHRLLLLLSFALLYPLALLILYLYIK